MTGPLKQLVCTRCSGLCGLLVAVLVLYSQTTGIPWYFDDVPAIVNNSSLRDLGARTAAFFAPRGPVDLSFAVNLRLNGLQVAGYHLVNITIHLANGVLFYLLLGRIFREKPLLQSAATMIFLLHPIQTQTVNYLVQRYTLAAAFCGLVSLLLIVRWWEGSGFPWRSPAAAATYAAALFFSALSVLCKQNMAVMFIVVPLFCAFFIERERSKKELFLYLFIPFAIFPFWEGLRQVVYPLVTGSSLGGLSGLLPSPDSPPVSPLFYMATQWKVIWVYLRLLVLPYGQALDYGYPLATAVLTGENLAALAGLCLLVSIAWSVRNRLPRISFGIAWFFIFLLVESTLIPLDPLFEHRLYLPTAGFAIIVADLLARIPGRRTLYTGVALIFLLLGTLTWKRNSLWLSPPDLLIDNVKKYPGNARVYAGAANALAAAGDTEKGRAILQQGFRRGLRHEAMYISLENIFIAEGHLPEAVGIGEEGLHYYPRSENLLYSTGLAEDLRGNHSRAEQHFRRAIAVSPEREEGYSNLGTSLDKQGRWEEAAAAYRKSVEINPLYVTGHCNLGLALYNLRRMVEAEEEFKTAYRLGGDERALYFLVVVKAESGERDEAERLLRKLESIDPAKAGVLRRLLLQ